MSVQPPPPGDGTPADGPIWKYWEHWDWDYGATSTATTRRLLTEEQRVAVRNHLRSKLTAATLSFFSDDTERDAKITAAIQSAFAENVVRPTRGNPLPPMTPENLREIYADVAGLGPLERYIRDPNVTSVSVIRHDLILVERGAEREVALTGFRDEAHLEQVAETLAVLSGYTLNRRTNPRMTHFSVRPPARIHIDINATDGPFIAFRRGREKPWPLNELVRRGAMTSAVAELLTQLARAEAPLLVVGPPGSGKTTLLEAMIHELPARHLVIVEDGAFELHPDHPYATHIVVPPRPESELGTTGGDVAEALKAALRKNCDQLVVGEVMDGNAGHIIGSGTAYRWYATTTHGIDAKGGLARFAILAQLANTMPPSPYVGLDRQAREDMASGLKVVVVCGRLADDRQVIREVAWIDGLDTDGNFALTPLATIKETVTERGIEAQWMVNPDPVSIMAEQYRVNLEAADLNYARRMIVGVEAATARRQAIAAMQAGNWQRAVLYFSQAIHAASGAAGPSARKAPNSLMEMLRRCLNNCPQWPDLLQQAHEISTTLNYLMTEREWGELESALAALDGDILLYLAVTAMTDMRVLNGALLRGRELDATVLTRIRTAARLEAGRRDVQALQVLIAPSTAEYLQREHHERLLEAAAPLWERLSQNGEALAPALRLALDRQMARLRLLAGGIETEMEAEHTEESTFDTMMGNTVATTALIRRLAPDLPAQSQAEQAETEEAAPAAMQPATD